MSFDIHWFHLECSVYLLRIRRDGGGGNSVWFLKEQIYSTLFSTINLNTFKHTVDRFLTDDSKVYLTEVEKDYITKDLRFKLKGYFSIK